MSDTTEQPEQKTVPELRQLAAELGVDVDKIQGTGSGGDVIKPDLVAAIAAHQVQPPAGEPGAPDTPAPAAPDADAPGGDVEDQPPSDPAAPGGDSDAGEPDAPATDAEDAVEVDGYLEYRKPITEVDQYGNWTDPFSGLRVYHSTDVCVQSGAHRDGDEAVLRVPKVA
jgi:pyruvate/2-oxoglutarate dehydrogenase complex dihydrolipoamide acyltransferase (E2) component